MIIHVLQLGVGNVGRALVGQILSERAELKSRRNLEIVFCGLFNVNTGAFSTAGLTADQINSFPDSAGHEDPATAIAQMPKPFVVVDATSSAATLPLLQSALRRGGAAVLANKKPLAGLQSDFDALMRAGKNRLYFETTVGAGLPIISTLRDLIITGDKIERMTGCFSGTLGYIFSEIEAGRPYSQAVSAAKAHGYTEPDPRDDLSGIDVMRKVIILARLTGRRLEPDTVTLEGIFPDSMAKLSVDEFMSKIPKLDEEFEARSCNAKAQGNVLRYTASVTPKSCVVKLEAVPKNSDIGSLNGPDNIVVIQTERYHDNPLIIKGPGAGANVTAAGVFADIIKAAEVLRD
jgi:homoserine dehydrogenase